MKSQSRSRIGALSLSAAICAMVVSCVTAPDSRVARAAPSSMNCGYWQSKVDPSVPLQGARLDELPGDAEAVEAIRCLLRLRGRTEPGRFGGATRFDVSQVGPEPAIEVAALYYVTYIYERSWGHGDAVMIVGPNGVNTKATVRQAFEAVARWVATVERMGMAEVRAQRLHPFRGTSLHWYGRRPEPDDVR